MTRHRVTAISFLLGPDADLKAAADELVVDNGTLKVAMDAHTNAAAELAIARTTLLATVGTWDSAYGVYVSAGEKYALVPNDAHALGCAALGRTLHPLAVPLGVDLGYDAKKDLLRAHVHRAPGMHLAEVQVSPDPVTATSWALLPGGGAVPVVASPVKGTWWARARSVTARAKSDFTTAVSVIVK
jgi:hypothetical protein